MIVEYFENPSHRESEKRAFAAERAQRTGRDAEARLAFAEAARLEEAAAIVVPGDLPKVRTVLAISATSLWGKAVQWAEAARCAAAFLEDREALTPDGATELETLAENAQQSSPVIASLDRLRLLSDARTRGAAAHETRLVQPNGRRNNRDPQFVSTSLKRWSAFFEAAAEGVANLQVALMAPGSLRIVLTSSQASYGHVMPRYGALVECGTDEERLGAALRTGQVTAPYYELVDFLASNECDLEVYFEPRPHELAVVQLSATVAVAQRAALARPRSEVASRRLSGRVTAASMTRGTLELDVDGERLDGHVAPESRHFLKGLRIGGTYRFHLEVARSWENPSAHQRVDLRIIEMTLAEVESRLIAPPHPAALPKRRTDLVWFKKMTPTDALKNAGNKLGYVQLTRAGHHIDHATWFHDVLFESLPWETHGSEERALAPFSVDVRGLEIGTHNLRLTYSKARLRHHRQPTTRLYWEGDVKELLLRRGNNMTKKYLVLRRTKGGELQLSIADDPPGSK
jgi:hypothetical protein